MNYKILRYLGGDVISFYYLHESKAGVFSLTTTIDVHRAAKMSEETAWQFQILLGFYGYKFDIVENV